MYNVDTAARTILKGFSINPCNTDRQVFSRRIIDDGQGRQEAVFFWFVLVKSVTDTNRNTRGRELSVILISIIILLKSLGQDQNSGNTTRNTRGAN